MSPGTPGYQAAVVQAHLAGHSDARIWISNPGWLLRVGSLDRFGSLAGFASAMQAGDLQVAPGEHVAFADPEHGAVRLDWSGAFSVAGSDRRHDVLAVDPELTLDDGRTLDLRAIGNSVA